MTVRALFRAAKVTAATPPYDTLHVKVFYPARLAGGDQEQTIRIAGFAACRHWGPFRWW